MKPNRWITLSRRVYVRLLNFYPREHRVEYGPSMLQMFADQCRFAYEKTGVWGLLSLWPRTLGDVCTNSLREHLASPRLSWGLLEAVPNEPLPWKGVLLVIIPGVIFLVGQIAQLSGTDWFFVMYYRAAYLLIIPVVLIWLFARKVPIWGLMPIGILYNTIWWVVYRLQFDMTNSSNPVLSIVMRLIRKYDTSMRQAVVSVGILATLILLIGWAVRRQLIARRAWAWMGAYVLLAAVSTLYDLYDLYRNSMGVPLSLSEIVPSLLYWDFLVRGGFLLLILFGALLARRHGLLAVLVPLGYLLSMVLVGRFDAEWETPQFMFWISVGTLVFRVLVALVAPIWILRAIPGKAQRRAARIALLLALVIQLILYVGMYGLGVGWIIGGLIDPLILAAGVFLALNLYQAAAPTATEDQSMALAASA